MNLHHVHNIRRRILVEYPSNMSSCWHSLGSTCIFCGLFQFPMYNVSKDSISSRVCETALQRSYHFEIWQTPRHMLWRGQSNFRMCNGKYKFLALRNREVLRCKVSRSGTEWFYIFSEVLLGFLWLGPLLVTYPDNKVHGANMGPTWFLSAPDGPHVGPMNLAIKVY